MFDQYIVSLVAVQEWSSHMPPMIKGMLKYVLLRMHFHVTSAVAVVNRLVKMTARICEGT